MSTQPIRKRETLPAPAVSARWLLGIAALFVVVGAISLYLAAPTASLTPWHLVALVAGWAVSWGGTCLLLNKKLDGSDPYIVPIVALLTGWGLLILARLAPAFLLRQILWLGIGCIALCATALVPIIPRLLRRYRYTLLAAGLLLLGTTLIFGVNPSGYGQRLWLGAFGIYFQPSEALKLLLVIYLSAYLSERRGLLMQDTGDKPLWLAALGPMLTMVGIALLLLGWQQDLGGALLFYLTFVAMLYLAWGKGWHVALSLLLFAPVAVAGYLLSSRVALRVSIWLDPWAPEQADRAFQILQSLFALASGGLAGEGIGQGLPTLIPAVHTDFVYAALVEEFGLAGGVALIILLALLVYRGILLAQRSESVFESLLAGGITALLAIQTWVIVGGNAKLIPITGVTLPFLSYGGSSLLTVLIAVGLLLNISAPHPEPITLTLTQGQMPSPKQTAGRMGRALLILLASVVLSTGFWAVMRAESLRDYVTNPRRILAESRIRRGRILDRNGIVLADIEVDDDGYVTRTYPVPEAAPVVGYYSLQYGTYGIEGTCDTRLRGDIERTAWDVMWDGLLHQSPTGRNVRLTIDAPLQQAAQQLLADYTGAAILIDTRTGEILALASSPTYNPATVETDWDSLYDAPNAPLLNRATQGLAQPGTVLQTILLSTILQTSELTTPAPTFTDPVSINGEQLVCAQPPADRTWRATLNAGCPAPFAAFGADLGIDTLAQSFTAWGLTDAPSLDIPAVAAPWEPETADAVREAVGQGNLLVTPAQMVSVAATLGNDGVRVPLQLLSAATPGCTSKETTDSIQVINAADATALLDLWPRFGKAVGHIGDALAGPNRTQTWFIGLNSPDVPRYAVAVLIDNPNDRQIPAQIGTQLLKQIVDQ